jgi:hypothetical protein
VGDDAATQQASKGRGSGQTEHVQQLIFAGDLHLGMQDQHSAVFLSGMAAVAAQALLVIHASSASGKTATDVSHVLQPTPAPTFTHL